MLCPQIIYIRGLFHKGSLHSSALKWYGLGESRDQGQHGRRRRWELRCRRRRRRAALGESARIAALAGRAAAGPGAPEAGAGAAPRGGHEVPLEQPPAAMPRARSGRRSMGAGGREEVDLLASASQPADPTECSDWENETEEAR